MVSYQSFTCLNLSLIHLHPCTHLQIVNSAHNGRWMATQPCGGKSKASVDLDAQPFEGVAEWINEDEDGNDHHHTMAESNAKTLAADPSTLSRPDLWRVLSTHFDLIADFDKKILSGYVDLAIEKQSSQDDNLVGTVIIPVPRMTPLSRGNLLQFKRICTTCL